MKHPETEIVQLTQKLVSFRSISYSEFDIALYVLNYLQERGVQAQLDRFNPGTFLGNPDSYQDTANVYVDVGSGDEALLLYGHLDVVDSLDEGQFYPLIKDGYLAGRGTVDMKSALAGMMVNIVKYYDIIANSDSRIIFVFVADEERSGTGARRSLQWLKGKHLDHLACILLEPTDDFTCVEIGAKGYIFIDLEAPLSKMIPFLRQFISRKRHFESRFRSANPDYGVCHISLTTINAWQEVSAPNGYLKPLVVEGKSSHASRPELGRNSLEEYLCGSTRPVEMIKTVGNSHNTIPARTLVIESSVYSRRPCQVSLDVRTTPEADHQDSLLKMLQIELQAEGIQHRVSKRGKAFGISPKSSLVTLCKLSAGGEIKEIVALGGSDAGYYTELTPLVIGGFGPGTRALQHSSSERISLTAISRTADVISNIIRLYLRDQLDGEVNSIRLPK